MFTAKDVQTLLHVDRSTVYRMAESGRLPAIKIGRQWRFPADQFQAWLKQQSTDLPATADPASPLAAPLAPSVAAFPPEDFQALLPLDCVQLIQDTFADTIGTMLVITDMDGNPVTAVSNPCGLFALVSRFPDSVKLCVADWARMGAELDLEPKLIRSHLGLLGARAFIRVGTELKGMVVIGGIAPDTWPPAPEDVQVMARKFGLTADDFLPHVNEVFYLDAPQQTLALSVVQRVATIVTHIITERIILVSKLNSIAELVNS